jgi:hypothetical protein
VILKNAPIVVISVVFCLLILSLFPNANALSTWQRTIGVTYSNGNSMPNSVIQTSDSGIALVTFRNGHIWLSKLDDGGSIKWEKDYGENFSGNQIVQEPDGGYMLQGWSGLAKLDSEGNILWNQTYEDQDSDVGLNSFYPTDDGGFIMGGTTSGYTGQWGQNGDTITRYEVPTQASLVKVDSEGSLEWKQMYSIQYMSTQLKSVVQTNDGGYVMTGMSGGQFTGTYGKIFLAKTDNLGNLLWDKEIGVENFGEYPTSMALTRDGGFIVAAVMDNNFSSAPGLIKFDSSGDVQWQELYGGDSSAGVSSVIQTKDGGYVFSGYIFSDSADGSYNEYFWLVNVDSSGSVQWERSFQIGEWDTADYVIQTNDGGYLMAGSYCPKGSDYGVPCLIKTDENGLAHGFLIGTSPSPTIPEIPFSTSLLFLTLTTLISFIAIYSKRKLK